MIAIGSDPKSVKLTPKSIFENKLSAATKSMKCVTFKSLSSELAADIVIYCMCGVSLCQCMQQSSWDHSDSAQF